MDELGSAERESVDMMLRAGSHLLDLINEALDVARIEAGTLPLSIEPVLLGEVVTEVVDLVRPLAQQRDLSVVACLPGEHDPVVRADHQRLKQVLLNLLSNAVKYNREGGSITITAEAGPEHARVEVVDTGPGIPPEQRARLFSPFERLGAERSRVEGTGLGLALSKQLIEAMDGTLGVESASGGGGSAFWFTLPLADGAVAPWEPDGAELPDGPTSAEPARTVLCIEDNPYSLRLIERLLRHRPHVRMLAAETGEQGLSRARNQRPDLVLLDLDLPDRPGHDVLRALKDGATTTEIPVVVVSADASPSRVRRLLAAGASDYLTKPLDLRHFLRVLDDVLAVSS
jgi:CheY-like chemotaxis protein